mmetsp:Transcript_11625/g.29497  ORF Transcript_11625/g.29497 Transcript_11625/m.29497 type:complete len:210 (-) Transcript_11625:23-652(-)
MTLVARHRSPSRSASSNSSPRCGASSDVLGCCTWPRPAGALGWAAPSLLESLSVSASSAKIGASAPDEPGEEAAEEAVMASGTATAMGAGRLGSEDAASPSVSRPAAPAADDRCAAVGVAGAATGVAGAGGVAVPGPGRLTSPSWEKASLANSSLGAEAPGSWGELLATGAGRRAKSAIRDESSGSAWEVSGAGGLGIESGAGAGSAVE